MQLPQIHKLSYSNPNTKTGYKAITKNRTGQKALHGYAPRQVENSCTRDFLLFAELWNPDIWQSQAWWSMVKDKGDTRP